ncbi:hypothetical protein A2130_02320 [Candidatus Woesebacteria bacterium GWC2_33_12]|uniref:Membrane protein 6-pyruvoyl-tetrahydropterin synthase-related domain-containing protein n=1 Tax=Candidatus Woesebacteria bacterium GW2011_GWB1_33_22 TaxID=1618566 RepID=A0A0F9ZMN5_9BACT|nr:MAG: hypothetical protein UR29_C0006G0003 [Candidatus Woesebacteria bacterium GW2011_GWC2_33_12]KKP42792.1 MAG: hypothetical protein UR33_C0001G0153 [Candidatus Woesebacteria bacterium GW2011_GWA2_33_20]KKP45434.1 MAG: hypothetical protein UR35_C0001G0031 [Candidatus Woesebacteria bacterium GW2011_GWB1_33_22]KKP46275.1 MAG: hypothetical protein UR37_C0010G0031 [Microgenomates group bacterium GW2011_GWC1_33_28]KKP50384.1 MAG: hypothetical protein UR41_C0009G0031 [Candidatus Woesebacteria bact
MVKFLRKHLIIIFIFALGLSVSWPLMKSGYFSHQDDLQIIRIFEMRRCFLDFQIPCRWVPDMGWGNGMPLFNFYGVAAYYVGGLLSFIFGFLGASKLLFFASLMLGSIGIYLLVNKLWGKYAGLTSAILYMFAPYKALDVYVRGALSESIALTIIPFVFYFYYKKGYILATLFLALFLITHNIMTVIFLPVLLLWILYLLYLNKFKDIKLVFISLFLALGMSSFFTLPAFLEKDLVQTESLTRFELDYRANFIGVKQLFLDRVWGYGTSIPGPEGKMNFQIGWPYWLLSISSLVVVFLKNSKRSTKYLIIAIFSVFILSIFMTHNKSSFIWERISILKFFQFPWRFLSLSIFSASILGGAIIYFLDDKWQKVISILIITLTIILNWGYFRPREYYDINDSQKLTGNLWEEQSRGALLDYLPKTALEPREGAPSEPLIVLGKANITNFINKTNKFSFNVEVDETVEIHLPIYYFPNWKIKVDGKNYPLDHDNLLGRISILLAQGQYKVVGNFRNTPIRLFANMISIFSIVGLLIWLKNTRS